MTFSNKEQMAGIANIDFFLLTETSDWPLIVNDNNASTITITPEDYEFEVDGTIEPESININDKPKLDASGKIWPIDINFTYNFRGVEIEKLLERNAMQPGIVRACFNDGSTKLYGTDQEPLYLDWSNVYGEKVDDRSGVNITIKGEQSHRPVYVL